MKLSRIMSVTQKKFCLSWTSWSFCINGIVACCWFEELLGTAEIAEYTTIGNSVLKSHVAFGHWDGTRITKLSRITLVTTNNCIIPGTLLYRRSAFRGTEHGVGGICLLHNTTPFSFGLSLACYAHHRAYHKANIYTSWWLEQNTLLPHATFSHSATKYKGLEPSRSNQTTLQEWDSLEG